MDNSSNPDHNVTAIMWKTTQPVENPVENFLPVEKLVDNPVDNPTTRDTHHSI